MGKNTQQLAQVEITSNIAHINAKLKRSGRASLSVDSQNSYLDRLTAVAIIFSDIPGAEDVVKLCHDGLTTLFQKWPFEPEETLEYIQLLHEQLTDTNSAQKRLEVRNLLVLLNDIQKQRGIAELRKRRRVADLHH